MIKIVAAAFLLYPALVFAQTPPATCPNLNGDYKYSELVANVTVDITQTACSTIEFNVNADVLGSTYADDLTSPLDGVTRQYKGPNANETDFGSAQFQGDTLVIIVERDVTGSNGQVTKSTIEAKAVLKSANVLEVTEGDLDSSGNMTNSKTFDLNRVSN